MTEIIRGHALDLLEQLDPFAGSGQLVKAAQSAGMKAAGYEINEE